MKKAVLALSVLCVGGVLSAQAPAGSGIDWGSAKNLYNDKPMLPPTDPALLNAPYRDSTLPIEKRIDDLMPRLTPEEKAEIVHGATLFTIGKIPRIGLAEGLTTDGPQGVHHRAGGISTAFPNGAAIAATWNAPLVEQTGKGLAEETKGTGAVVLLGPGVNMMRTPLNGRNFEYYGEDPFLAGKIAASYIRGVQSGGVGTCLKHWVLNDQEYDRSRIDVNVGDRALHEIYVRPFEIAVKESNPWSIMNSYNRIRGEHSTHNLPINRILTEGLKYDGALISDWGAWHDDIKSLNGGCTLAMPSKKDPARNAKIAKLVEEGKIDKTLFDDAVRRNLRLYFRCGLFDTVRGGQANLPETQALARKVAEESMLLLKNDGILPLDPSKITKIAVIGPNADQYHTTADGSSERGGSGSVCGPHEITPLAGLAGLFGKDKIIFAPGFRFGNPGRIKFDIPENDDPIAAAKSADMVIFCAGLSHSWDNEGRDKPSYELEGKGRQQAELLEKVIAANPKTIVLLINGSPMSLEPWADSVPAILQAWYAGQDAGRTIAEVLSGKVNPSGKLPFTYGRQLADYPANALGRTSYPGMQPDKKKPPFQFYGDYIWVGYRAFDKNNVEPRYPFGFGLSYTTFAVESAGQTNDGFAVKVTNTGKVAGAEVVQCYLTRPQPKPSVIMPVRELAGFQKVTLQPGESRVVSFKIEEDCMRYWSEEGYKWEPLKGTFKVAIGNSSRHLPVKYEFKR